jgi:hypothetical protein
MRRAIHTKVLGGEEDTEGRIASVIVAELGDHGEERQGQGAVILWLSDGQICQRSVLRGS